MSGLIDPISNNVHFWKLASAYNLSSYVSFWNSIFSVKNWKELSILGQYERLTLNNYIWHGAFHLVMHQILRFIGL